MSGGRAGLTGLLAVSLVLTLLPFASAAPVSVAHLASPSPSAFRVDLAALPGSGAMLLAASGASGVDFFEVAEDGSLPGARLASFELPSVPDDASLAGPRLAAASPSRVALAYTGGGAARLAVLDPYLGEVVADLALDTATDGSSGPSVVAVAGGFVASYLAQGSGGQVAVVSLSADGAVVSRASLTVVGALSAALVPSGPQPRLAVLTSDRVEVYALGAAPSLALTFSVSSTSGALWARAGIVHGLFSTASGLVRMGADPANPSVVSTSSVPGGARASSVAASESADGMLLAVVKVGPSTLALREEAIGQFASSSLADVRGASAASDAFGLARAALLRGPASLPSVDTFTAGDPDAVAVSVEGGSTIRPAGSASLTVHLRAVRSDLNVVGLSAALPSGWSLAAPALSLALARGAEALVAVTVTAPAGAAPGSYALAFTPAVLEVPVPSSGAFTIRVPAGPSLDVACCAGGVDLPPGGTTSLRLDIVNRGATTVVSDIVPQASAGFLVTPSVSSVSLEPGAKAEVTLTVSVLQGSLPLADASVGVIVRPSDGSGETAVSLPARIEGVFAPTLTFLPRSLDAAPGATVALPYALVNTGNAGGFVTLDSAVGGVPASGLAGLTGPVWVPAFSKVDLPLTLTVPPGTLAGVTYTVSLSATRFSDGAPAGGPLDLAGSVLARPALSATFRGAPSAAPGGLATGTLRLSNSGNVPLTVDLTFAAGEAGFVVSPSDGVTGGIAVPPGGVAERALSFRAAPLAAPGLRMFSLTASAGPAVGPVVLALPFEVETTHALALRLVAQPLPLASPLVTAASVDLEVRNGGNSPASVAFTFGAHLVSLAVLGDSGAPAPLATGTLGSVPAFGARTFRATLAPAFAQGDDLARASALVESTAGDAASLSLEFSRLRADPRVAEIVVVPPQDPERSANLHRVYANITNAGPGDAAELDAVLTVDGTVVGNVPVDQAGDLLKAGATRLVTFEFVPSAPTVTLTVAIVPRGVLLDRDLGNNALTLTVATNVRPPAPSAGAAEAAPVAASFSGLALLGLALSEIGKSTLISVLFLPLYVKLKPEEVLDQYLRGQIHGYIIANPGEHYNAIKDQLGVTNGALAYHLRVLERAGLIRANRDGMYKRFYPVGVKIPTRRRLSSFQEAVVKAVRDNPDVSQKRIAELLGVSNQVVNYHVKQLEDSGILRVDRTERASKVNLGPDAPPVEGPPAPALPLRSPTEGLGP